VTDAITRLPDDASVPAYWALDESGRWVPVVSAPIVLPRGTPCKLRPSGMMWEVVGGPHDGIRFPAEP